MKNDNFTKLLLTSIVLLGIIVVKDIDLPPKAQANLLGNNSKYQFECFALYDKREVSECYILNSETEEATSIRRALSLKTSQVIKFSGDLLGIELPNKM